MVRHRKMSVKDIQSALPGTASRARGWLWFLVHLKIVYDETETIQPLISLNFISSDLLF